MTKLDIGPQGFIYPMPMVLVGTDLETGPSFMALAWINRCQYTPPRLVLGMGKTHATNTGIRAHGELSESIPSVDMAAVTDWCGLHSANKGDDKAAPFTLTMPDNRFWAVGEQIANAWSVGRTYEG